MTNKHIQMFREDFEDAGGKEALMDDMEAHVKRMRSWFDDDDWDTIASGEIEPNFRLRYFLGEFHVHTGHPDFDTDHRGVIAATYLDPYVDSEDLSEMADEIVREIEEQLAWWEDDDD